MAPQTIVNGEEPLTNGVHGEDENGVPLLQNDSSKPWVVQKFGGTSVGKEPTVIAEGIVTQWLKNDRVAVVCSARSSFCKNDGTTNRLLSAAGAAEEDRDFAQIVEAIQNDHLAQADLHIRSPHLRASVRDQAVRECADLTGLLGAARRLGEVSDGTRDLIVSKGEKLSCIFMAALLRDRGVDARYVDLADAVVGKLLSTRPELDQEFYAELTTALTARVHACGAQVPVVTGYFGRVEGGLLRRIGRGYTDLCAALLAVGLGAAELQVWKEVDGIFTANPAKVPTARLLPEISPEEAAELTFYGSEVIHPFTMEQVIRAAIPIRIRNVMNLRNPGTLIRPDPALATPPPSRSAADDPPPRVGVFAATSPLHRRLHSTSHISGTATATGISLPTRVPRPKRPTAVTVKPAILVLNVLSNKRSLSHGFYARIFDTLDRFRLSVDLISTSEVHVSMALHSEKALQSGSGGSGQEGERRVVDADVAGAVEELRKCGTVDVLGGMAILSLVGRQMRNMMGIAGKMFSVLGENNVNIEMISQGSSEINISCVIEERDADRAINIIHTNLFTFLD